MGKNQNCVYGKVDLEKIPSLPGVYLMLDVKGRVLYVGKAVDLKSRVKQYVSGHDQRAMIPFLLEKVHSLETIVVSSEKEALLLEDTLIKEHKPKYNVRLKDDRAYPVLRINIKHSWPKISLGRIRRKEKTQDLIFGPFTQSDQARITLGEIHKFFQLRQCSDAELLRRTRPCILHQMGRCLAPCVALCSHEEYQAEVSRVMKFMRGSRRELLEALEKKMEAYSDALEYEKAQEVLEKIQTIHSSVASQNVSSFSEKKCDVMGIAREADQGVITVLHYRHGSLLRCHHYPFDHSVSEDAQVIESALMQLYQGMDPKHQERPDEVLVPHRVSQSLVDVLELKIVCPQKGEKKKCVELATNNAQAFQQHRCDQEAQMQEILLDLQEKLRLKNFPQVIECVDISHFSQQQPVASVVQFVGGNKETRGFRCYRIKTAKEGDDYEAMKEVLERRYVRAKKEICVPSLLIVDGGKGHLNVAKKVLSDLLLTTVVDIIALTKEDARHDKGLTQEVVYLPGRKDALRFSKHSKTLFLLQRIRDEAHRFAINYQKKRRSTSIRKSILDEIQGIGPKKKQRLLQTFGSVKKMEQAQTHELLAVEGMTPTLVQRIEQALARKKS